MILKGGLVRHKLSEIIDSCRKKVARSTTDAFRTRQQEAGADVGFWTNGRPLIEITSHAYEEVCKGMVAIYGPQATFHNAKQLSQLSSSSNRFCVPLEPI
jgi:hypothetical protein